MKRKPRKSSAPRKEKMLTQAELKKISAGLWAAADGADLVENAGFEFLRREDLVPKGWAK